jgi:ferredoxin-NADP reductase
MVATMQLHFIGFLHNKIINRLGRTVAMKSYVPQIEGYEKILKNVETRNVNGIDSHGGKRITKAIIDRINPEKIVMTVVDKIPRTENAVTIRMKSISGYLPPFQAGQYINIYVTINGVRTSRPYSISSSPRQRDFYDITVARIENGFVTDYILDEMQFGDTVETSAPAGHFVYSPMYQSKDAVYIAGGSGITPFMSKILDVVEAQKDRNIHLIYGNRNEKSTIFLNELKALAHKYNNFKLTLVMSEPEEGYKGQIGFINNKCILNAIGTIENKRFSLCGPPVMCDFCLKALAVLGVKDNNIRRELFGARQDIGDEQFTIKVGDKTIPALSKESVMTSFERAGFQLKALCSPDECSLCRVKLVSGSVFMPRGVLQCRPDEKSSIIHSCKSYPISDIEVLVAS